MPVAYAQAPNLLMAESWETAVLSGTSITPNGYNGWVLETSGGGSHPEITSNGITGTNRCYANQCLDSGNSLAGATSRVYKKWSNIPSATGSWYMYLFAVGAGSTLEVKMLSSATTTTALSSKTIFTITRPSSNMIRISDNGGTVVDIPQDDSAETSNLLAISWDFSNQGACTVGFSYNFGALEYITPLTGGTSANCYNNITSGNGGMYGIEYSEGAGLSAYIDNILVSGDRSYIDFSTTTAPFSSTNLDEFCGEIATSTGFLDSIGSSFSNGICRTFAYFFIPNTQAVLEFQGISSQITSKFPFAWAADIQEIYREQVATTTSNFINLTIPFGTSTQIFGFQNLTVISTSTMSQYLPESVRLSIKTLIAALFYLLAAAFIYRSIQHIWHKQV